MKIEPALIAAIKAAAKNQPANKPRDHLKERAEHDSSIRKLCRKDKPLARAIRRNTEILREQKRIRDLINKRGVGIGQRAYIADSEKFVKAGGVFNAPDLQTRWSSEQVLARLAYAKPADRPKILAEYGIDWT